MLNDRQKIDLDNYITGHWGEDQFKNDEPEPDDDEPLTDDDPEGDDFFNLLSGKIEYSVQWAAWERFCHERGTNPETVFAVLQRARAATH